jgi:hypothetical protein
MCISCDNIRREYHENNKLKSSYYLKNGKFHGIYKEYYDSGLIKEITNYDNGILSDSSVFYDKLGNMIEKRIRINDSLIKVIEKNDTLKCEGFLDKGFKKVERWHCYDIYTGLLKKIKEYKLIKGESILNQNWVFDSEKDTLFEKSKFFDLSIDNDTISIGETVYGIIYFRAPLFSKKDSEIEVILPSGGKNSFNNDFSNFGKLSLDTFPSINNNSKIIELFPGSNPKHISLIGKRFSSSGKKIVRGVIVEYYYDGDISKQESQIRKENKTYFEKQIFVKKPS